MGGIGKQVSCVRAACGLNRDEERSNARVQRKASAEAEKVQNRWKAGMNAKADAEEEFCNKLCQRS
eukprot:2371081-Pleurochrysis_carterae.AAC.1